ncbi:extracellular solute-binding protein [Paenibacillus doosanensis]|uniref:ABC transporter substrate-binding protein n=1 Tax=Paenibacillus doosanensis TaxID=1229154 RepID=UPI0021806F7E|nr:extracellular solute-binding protein [Paenibacillus doosanensis]MCS7458597.1 extracellular solute-binding protein [Paenibacillus doosanensis]
MSIVLKGITWHHSRGFVPLAATAQRFAERNPGVEIVWEKRSLQQFADAPIEQLAERYDLLVIDHPWAGFAADRRILVPLERHLPASFLEDQGRHSVGRSHESYNFGGYQSALAIDAATPVASYREDIMAREAAEPPTTWEELLALAERGLVAFPGIPIDTLMNFYMLCSSLGEDPFLRDDEVVSCEIGIQALERLKELAGYCPQEMFGWNPIQLYEAMAVRGDIAYCPFAYGYSNYSRPGYAANVITFADTVRLGERKLRTTLGGTGLAVSVRCRHLDEALQYAMYTADPATQRTLYAQSGGQPGHRAAWTDAAVNRSCGGYFERTLTALDRSFLRPRYSGYLHFQDRAGDFVRRYAMQGGDAGGVLEKLNDLYRDSRREGAL